MTRMGRSSCVAEIQVAPGNSGCSCETVSPLAKSLMATRGLSGKLKSSRMLLTKAAGSSQSPSTRMSMPSRRLSPPNSAVMRGSGSTGSRCGVIQAPSSQSPGVDGMAVVRGNLAVRRSGIAGRMKWGRTRDQHVRGGFLESAASGRLTLLSPYGFDMCLYLSLFPVLFHANGQICLRGTCYA